MFNAKAKSSLVAETLVSVVGFNKFVEKTKSLGFEYDGENYLTLSICKKESGAKLEIFLENDEKDKNKLNIFGIIELMDSGLELNNGEDMSYLAIPIDPTIEQVKLAVYDMLGCVINKDSQNIISGDKFCGKDIDLFCESYVELNRLISQ